MYFNEILIERATLFHFVVTYVRFRGTAIESYNGVNEGHPDSLKAQLKLRIVKLPADRHIMYLLQKGKPTCLFSVFFRMNIELGVLSRHASMLGSLNSWELCNSNPAS